MAEVRARVRPVVPETRMRTGLLSLLLLSLAFAIVSPRMVSTEGHRARRCAYFRYNMYSDYFGKGKCHENL